MSSFPKHVENIEKLKNMGFDVDDAYEDGIITLESWGYDELTYMISDIIRELEKQKFNVKTT